MFASRRFPLGAKGRLYSACMRNVIIHGHETSLVKKDVIRLDKNDAWMVRTRLKLKSMRECLQERSLQWFGHLERMESA